METTVEVAIKDLPTANWGNLLTKLGTDALGKTKPVNSANPGKWPGTTSDIHAHHIVMRVGQGPEAQKAVQKSQEILRKYGINPFFGKENLVWAPNWNHTTEYANAVLDALEKADKIGNKDAIMDALTKVAKEFIRGAFNPP